MKNPDPITVVPYNPHWPEQFVALSSKIQKCLSGIIKDIHHVGSTAVPGLEAKPIIDIDIILFNLADIELAIAALNENGYYYLGEMGISGRHAFSDTNERSVAHNLYICDPHSPAFLNHIALRDHLRGSQEAREAYGNLKKQLASLHPFDIEQYVHGKTAFIADVLMSSGLSRPSIEQIRKENS
ncbi:GrpB family protein [Pedobacter deserti]|uniref:GrpB family protein n=1 Tax=Pedobacter deserti TaxID=2817382 RepID=UPI00210AAEF5|nr:GrpB family protein [Pedobacter sp. SYSU D00382]